MNVLLSIIIPVFNVEAFVHECLDSVFRQLPDRVEVLVIDDGSPDASMDIIRREFRAWIDSGVLVLLEQPNAGPGAARNTGLAHARGSYIGFLDSDDVLLDGYFNSLMDRMELGMADIIEFGFKRFKDGATLATQPHRRLYRMRGLKKLESVRELVFARTRWYPSLRIFRRSVLSGFRFPEAVHYEDTMSIPGIFLGNWFIQYLDKPLLGYRERPGSITSSHSRTDMETLYRFYRSIPLDAPPALLVMKVGLVRTLTYFYRELKTFDFPMDALIRELEAIKLSRSAQEALEWPDWFLYKAPRNYLMINTLRIRGAADRKLTA